MEKTLRGFFAQNARKIETVPFVVSDRFTEEEEPLVWEIGCITAGENNRLRQSSMCQVPGLLRGQTVQELDAGLYQARLAARCTLYPRLTDRALQDSYGVQSAEELIETMLLPGEFERYCEKVLESNGFQAEAQLVETAKN